MRSYLQRLRTFMLSCSRFYWSSYCLVLYQILIISIVFFCLPGICFVATLLNCPIDHVLLSHNSGTQRTKQLRKTYFSWVRVTRSLFLCVCFVDRCLFCCTFSFGHCVVCSSLIYRFWLPFGIFKLFLIGQIHVNVSKNLFIQYTWVNPLIVFVLRLFKYDDLP